jgi:hypothetical protein
MKSEFTLFLKLLSESGLNIALSWLNARLKTLSRQMIRAQRFAKEYFYSKPNLAHVFHMDFIRLKTRVARILDFLNLYETHFEDFAICEI